MCTCSHDKLKDAFKKNNKNSQMWRLLKTMQLGSAGMQFPLIKDTYLQLSHFEEENLSDATTNSNNFWECLCFYWQEGNQKEPELQLRFCICCFSLQEKKEIRRKPIVCFVSSSSSSSQPRLLRSSSLRQQWKHWIMQPNQTLVCPITELRLTALGWPPSLWSLETLVIVGIILGFTGGSTLSPSVLVHTLSVWEHRRTQILTKHAQRQTGPMAHCWILQNTAEFWRNIRFRCFFVVQTSWIATLSECVHIFTLNSQLKSEVFCPPQPGPTVTFILRWVTLVSWAPFNQCAASSSSNYCSEHPSPSLSNLSITHIHLFHRSHKSLLSLLHSSSKLFKGGLDTCVNNRWRMTSLSTPFFSVGPKKKWRCLNVLLAALNSSAVWFYSCLSVRLYIFCLSSPTLHLTQPLPSPAYLCVLLFSHNLPDVCPPIS